MFFDQIPSSALYKYLSTPIKYISKENNKRVKLHTTVNDKHDPGGGMESREKARLYKTPGQFLPETLHGFHVSDDTETHLGLFV